MRLRRSVAVYVSSLLAWSCSETAQDIEPTGALSVTPSTLDFGEVELGARVTRRLTVTRARLPARGLAVTWGAQFERDFSFAVVDDVAGFVDVTFAPSDGGDARGELVVQQAGAAPVAVALAGRAVSTSLRVSTSELDFGTVPIGQTRARTVRVSNVGLLPVELFIKEDTTVARCGGAAATPFCVAAEARVRLGAQASLDLEVRFAPQAVVAEVAGQLVVRACAECAAHAVALTGRVAQASLSCTPSLDLGVVDVGACASGAVRCAYPSGAGSTVTTWGLAVGADPAFTVSPPPPPGRLSPGEAVEVQVTFCPSTGGERTATLLVEDDNPVASERVHLVPLRGRAASGQDLEVTPSVIELTSTLIAPARRDVVARNRGTAPVSVSAVSVEDGVRTGFGVAAVGGFVLQPGEARAITVELAAQRVGPVVDALIVRSDDPDQPEVRVELRGVGVDLPPCAFEVAPPTLDFGAVEVGRSLRRAIEVRNVGPADCLISGARLLGSSPALALAEPVAGAWRLGAADRAVIAVDFVPPSAGAFGDQLELGVSNPTTPYVAIPVQAQGVASTPLVAPREVEFGAVDATCATREETVTVHNTTPSPLVFSNIALEAPGSSTFAVLGAPVGVPIAPGGSASFRVAYRPGTPGAHAAAVRLDAQSGSWRVALAGREAAAARQEDRFEVGAAAVDLLLVVDDSGGMYQHQLGLADNIDALMAYADAAGVDYRVGVTTTDVFMRGGRLAADVLLPDARPLGGGAVAAAIRQLGEDGSADERGLEALYLAFSPPLGQGANAALLRPSAVLSVLVLSDEEDSSDGVVGFYRDFLGSLKGRYSGRVARLFGVVGDVPSGCVGLRGSAAAGGRYSAVAEATGGLTASICTPDLEPVYGGLAPAVWGVASNFELTAAPVESSIEVRVDGVLVPRLAAGGGEQWTVVGRRVVFTPVAAPDAGAEVSVTFTPACP